MYWSRARTNILAHRPSFHENPSVTPRNPRAGLKPGDLVSEKYRLVRRLGSGGMAEVWAATNVHTERHFAIKLILPAMARKSEASERFLREARAAGRLRHP